MDSALVVTADRAGAFLPPTFLDVINSAEAAAALAATGPMPVARVRLSVVSVVCTARYPNRSISVVVAAADRGLG
jgi:hypothetical protein